MGLTHIIAVSGYNLTIIVQATRRSFGKRSKYQALWCAVGLLVGFLLITGFNAAIVRAALVSGLSLLAWYYGRTFKPLLLLALTAALTAGWYPLYLWSDIGWYLSFLAFYGVLVLAPLCLRRVYRRRSPSVVVQLLAESTAAQLMTLPLILYIFGQMSLVALLANLLVVPLVPLAMLLALTAGLSGMIITSLAGWFAWPARLLLTYILEVSAVLARIPHALTPLSIAAWQMIAMYICIAVWSLLMLHATRGKHDTIPVLNKEIVQED